MSSHTSLTKGMKFGKWTIISDGPVRIDGHVFYICQCECLAQRNMRYSTLADRRSDGCKRCYMKQIRAGRLFAINIRSKEIANGKKEAKNPPE